MNSTSFTSIESECAGSNDKMANIDCSSTAHLTLNAAPNNTSSSSSSSNNNNNNNNINNNNNSSRLACTGNTSAGNATGRASISSVRGRIGGTSRDSTNSNDVDSDSTTADRKPLGVTVITSSSLGASGDSNHHQLHHQLHVHHNQHLHELHSAALVGEGGRNQSSQLITGGFSLSNRLHLTKHQRTLWSRASSREKLLIFIISLLIATLVMSLMSLVSLLVARDNSQPASSAVVVASNNQTTSSLATCNHQPETGRTASEQTQNYCLTPDCVKVAASLIEAIDLTVDPCDDFYLYSCGDWIKSNPLPDGKSNWGTFGKLWQDNQSIMRSVLESANFKPGSAEEKAKIYYESCLDRNDTVESRGTKPMQDLIESAGGWSISGAFNVNSWDLQSSLQIYHNQYNRGGLFSWAVGADERNSTRNIIQLDQGGLGLPSRDHYLNKTEKNVLDAYLIYMTKVAELMGGTNVEEQMKEVLEFEKKLAKITVPQDQRRDDERMYHKFTLKQLTSQASFLNWTKYFDDAFDYHSRTTISFSSEIKPKSNRQDGLNDGIKNQTEYSLSTHNLGQPSDSTTNSTTSARQTTTSTISKHTITEDENIVIYSPEYFIQLSRLIQTYTATEQGKTTLANYMAWSVIQSLIATLPKNFRDASKILRKALVGSEGIEVSWRYCVTDTNQVMGFALGSLFVRRVFQGESKERAVVMIDSIRNAFKDNLPNLSWMDDRTRSLAKEKADNINQMIGFPDFILNPEKLNNKYEGLELDENNYFENNIKVNVLSLRENMEKINKLANKTEWEMTPPMVNAYYTPTKNQIVLPAGILQTPFYDLSFPYSLNYGAMGVVMGHELTHAFDDQGREYDKDGNLYQWWCNETLKNFEERVKCFVDQYSSYKIDESPLNGKQTLGENIADNGGLKAAFRAFEKWSDSHPEPRLPGLNLTSKQLFFVGFAQVWCSISTTEALKLQVLNDPHAPAQFRVIGTLSNSHEFAREFNCNVGSNMNPEKKCVVW